MRRPDAAPDDASGEPASLFTGSEGDVICCWRIFKGKESFSLTG